MTTVASVKAASFIPATAQSSSTSSSSQTATNVSPQVSTGDNSAANAGGGGGNTAAIAGGAAGGAVAVLGGATAFMLWRRNYGAGLSGKSVDPEAGKTPSELSSDICRVNY